MLCSLTLWARITRSSSSLKKEAGLKCQAFTAYDSGGQSPAMTFAPMTQLLWHQMHPRKNISDSATKFCISHWNLINHLWLSASLPRSERHSSHSWGQQIPLFPQFCRCIRWLPSSNFPSLLRAPWPLHASIILRQCFSSSVNFKVPRNLFMLFSNGLNGSTF